MKEFCCGDVVPGCEMSFRGTSEEILQAVGRHAREAHGIEVVPPALIEQVRSLMREAA